MKITDKIKATILKNEKEIGCQVIVNEESKELCGNEMWGRGIVRGHQIKYCKKDNHVPSDATPWNSGRVESLVFYIPEDDIMIEVE
jgi:hypothetical protein